MKILFLVVIISLAIAFFWDKFTPIKESIHSILDPTAGSLLNWNANIGMLIIAFFITFILTLLQKYTTDQDTLRQIKKEQKLLQEEMKKYKENPDKLMELQKKSLDFIPRTMDITMRPLIFTAIPVILFLRWFADYFSQNPVKIFGFFSGIWAYIVFSIIFSIILRKTFNVA